jgi:hypothetical protein
VGRTIGPRRHTRCAYATIAHGPTGLLPTDFGHADELIEQGLHCARVELRRHHAPVRSLRRAA